jgi:hypothetical protein
MRGLVLKVVIRGVKCGAAGMTFMKFWTMRAGEEEGPQ